MSSQFESWFFFGLFVVIIIALSTYLFLPGEGRFFLAIMPHPETFTELYFEKHLSLPERMTGNTLATVSATIHNLEAKQMTYPVEVFAQTTTRPPERVTFLQKEVTLENNEAKTIPVEFKIPDSFQGRVEVIFLLKNNDQSIHFWLEIPTKSSSRSATVRQLNAPFLGFP